MVLAYDCDYMTYWHAGIEYIYLILGGSCSGGGEGNAYVGAFVTNQYRSSTGWGVGACL